jgi:hypothetical protein
MYYETIPHELAMYASPVDVAAAIKSGNTPHYVALGWISPIGNEKMICVSDNHADGRPFYETAILKEHGSGEYYQVETYTFGHMSEAQVIEGLIEIQDPRNWATMGKTSLIIDKVKGSEVAWFDCGCCGTRFKDNVKRQLEFGQDAGFGICRDCDHYYT